MFEQLFTASVETYIYSTFLSQTPESIISKAICRNSWSPAIYVAYASKTSKKEQSTHTTRAPCVYLQKCVSHSFWRICAGKLNNTIRCSAISPTNIFHTRLGTDRFQLVCIDDCVFREKEVNYFTVLIRQQCPRYLYKTVHTFHAVRSGHGQRQGHIKKRRKINRKDRREWDMERKVQ